MNIRKFRHKIGFWDETIDYVLYESDDPNQFGKVIYQNGSSSPCSSKLEEAESHVANGKWIEIFDETPMKPRRFTHKYPDIFEQQGIDYIEFTSENGNGTIVFLNKTRDPYFWTLQDALRRVKHNEWIEIFPKTLTPLPKFKPGENVYVMNGEVLIYSKIQYSEYRDNKWKYIIDGFMGNYTENELFLNPPGLDN